MKSYIKHGKIISHLFYTLPLLLATSSWAAQYDAQEYQELLADANTKGHIRVLIALDDTITLENMASRRIALQDTLKTKAQTVLAELGQNALVSGHWNNGLGQMGAYVNEAGLHILAASHNAISFTRDVTHAYRIKAVDDDGSLDAIENTLIANGSADVEVFFNVDTADYDLDESGHTIYQASTDMSVQAKTMLDKLSKKAHAKGIKQKDHDFDKRPVARMNIDRTAFYALIESDDIRAIRSVGHQDTRMAHWPEDAFEAAKENNDEIEVIISLRGGELFSAKTGYMTQAAIQKQAKANQRAFDSIFRKIGHENTDSTNTSQDLGILQTKLTFDALTKLYDHKDPRILSIEINKPELVTMLTNSTSLMNMSPSWNAGYRAAGQNIVIIDSGVRKDHAFFKTNGVSRVTYEACFGTNKVNGGIAYSSICPSQDSSGGSPLNLLGSGEPYANLTVCNALAASQIHDCGHGTHVAGIAAGRQSASITPSNLQGIGPDAWIVAIQVFSYNNTVPSAIVFNGDYLRALKVLYDNTVPGYANPYTVNMSLGTPAVYADTASCTAADTLLSIRTTIKDLTSRGVPVVIATGNSGSKNGISFPACLPDAIKVSAVLNDAAGTGLPSFANIGKPSNFTGPILLAPGGGGATFVRSSDRATTVATKQMQGTSQATPHAAGMYAAVKSDHPAGISVADVTAWVITIGSIGITYNLPAPVGTQSFRRLRAP